MPVLKTAIDVASSNPPRKMSIQLWILLVVLHEANKYYVSMMIDPDSNLTHRWLQLMQ
jgi:hypothetical protein